MKKLFSTAIIFIGAMSVFFSKNPILAGADENVKPMAIEIIENEPTVECIVVEDISVTENTVENPKYRAELTEEEIDLLALMVMSEQSYKAFDSKCILVATALNRLMDDTYEFRYTNTIEDVLKAYSTSSEYEVSEECYQAVYTALDPNNNICPADVFWYCEGFQPPWGVYYTNIGESYYTSIKNYND